MAESLTQKKQSYGKSPEDIHRFLKILPAFITDMISLFFAFNVVVIFLKIEHSVIEWFVFILLALIINILVFVSSKKDSLKSYFWNFFLFSPALTIFILNFVFDSINQSWQASLETIDGVYTIVVDLFVNMPIYFILILFGFILSVSLEIIIFEKLKNKVLRGLISTLGLFFFGLWIYFLDTFILPIYGVKLLYFTGKAIRLLFSFSPIHWFYLLFTRPEKIGLFGRMKI